MTNWCVVMCVFLTLRYINFVALVFGYVVQVLKSWKGFTSCYNKNKTRLKLIIYFLSNVFKNYFLIFIRHTINIQLQTLNCWLIILMATILFFISRMITTFFIFQAEKTTFYVNRTYLTLAVDLSEIVTSQAA